MAQVDTFKYLDIPAGLGKPVAGRGGSVRFFMMYHGVEYNETLVSLGDWNSGVKDKVISSNENPAGHLPVLNTSAGVQLIEHVPIMRYIAAVNKLESAEGVIGAAKQDIIASAQQLWRDDLVKAAFSDDAETKKAYTEEKAGQYLKLMEALYTKYKDQDAKSPFIAPTESGKALWGDLAVFGNLHDQIQLGLVDSEVYNEYPNLKAVYDSLSADAPIESWIANH